MSTDRDKTFFTSDWHVGHANVLEFDQRPFKTLDHMHRTLINNYNAAVGINDICYFLGDVGFAKSEDLKKVLVELQGIKILILGNHDKGATAMRRIGFDVVMNGAMITVANRLVTLSHCPLRGVFREDVSKFKNGVEGDHWHGEHKNGHYSLPDFGQFHLHGHTHKPPEERILGRQFDVGVRANDYRPVSVSVVESWITRHLLGHSGGTTPK